MSFITLKSRWFLVIVAMMAALPPFAIDTYTPGIHAMSSFFHESDNRILITISTYLIGFSLGMLIWGPLSDILGRKKVITIGLTLYVIATISSSFCIHLNSLAALRFFQAFGDSAGVGVAFTMLRDSYSGQELTRKIATIIMMVMLAPLIAPMIGSLLLGHQHWQNIFYFLTAYGVILLVASQWLPETLNDSERIHLRDVLPQYRSHLTNLRFMTLSFCTACAFGATFSFIGASSLIYMTIYHTSTYFYSLLFGFNAVAIFIGSYTQKRLTYLMTPRQVQFLGLLIFCVSDVGMLLVTHFLDTQWWAFTPFIFCTTYGLCLLIGSLMSDAMNSVSVSFGTATSILNCMRNGGAAIASALMGHWLIGSVEPLPLQQLALGVIVLVLLIFLLLQAKPAVGG
jgi:MFS transporter, DHA1 family, multidrug resistance protein